MAHKWPELLDEDISGPKKFRVERYLGLDRKDQFDLVCDVNLRFLVTYPDF